MMHNLCRVLAKCLYKMKWVVGNTKLSTFYSMKMRPIKASFQCYSKDNFVENSPVKAFPGNWC